MSSSILKRKSIFADIIASDFELRNIPIQSLYRGYVITPDDKNGFTKKEEIDQFYDLINTLQNRK